MKLLSTALILCFFTFVACKKSNDPAPGTAELKFAPTDVIVKMKVDVTIEKVFELINSYDHDVAVISSSIYTSSLPPDSLRYVMDQLHKKPYLADATDSKTGGYLHPLTQIITLFPKLYKMNDKNMQADWLLTMKELKLNEVQKETGGYLLLLHVPENEEKVWLAKFKQVGGVEWVQLNYYGDYGPFN